MIVFVRKASLNYFFKFPSGMFSQHKYLFAEPLYMHVSNRCIEAAARGNCRLSGSFFAD